MLRVAILFLSLPEDEREKKRSKYSQRQNLSIIDRSNQPTPRPSEDGYDSVNFMYELFKFESFDNTHNVLEYEKLNHEMYSANAEVFNILKVSM